MKAETSLEKPRLNSEKDTTKAIGVKINGEWSTHAFDVASGGYEKAKERFKKEIVSGRIEDYVLLDEKN
ncbi:MAG: hypothetical protein V1686_01320 [Patescibacteria group bacterium]